MAAIDCGRANVVDVEVVDDDDAPTKRPVLLPPPSPRTIDARTRTIVGGDGVADGFWHGWRRGMPSNAAATSTARAHFRQGHQDAQEGRRQEGPHGAPQEGGVLKLLGDDDFDETAERSEVEAGLDAGTTQRQIRGIGRGVGRRRRSIQHAHALTESYNSGAEGRRGGAERLTATAQRPDEGGVATAAQP